MSKATMISDAIDDVAAKVGACNIAARSILSEVVPFTKTDASDVLDADIDRIMSLAMDLVDARNLLADAKKDLDALKRRQA